MLTPKYETTKIALMEGVCTMRKKRILRLMGLIMLLAAVIYVFCALSCPTLGQTIYIGDFRFGAEQWRICYLIYVLVMVALFTASFFVKSDQPQK